MSELPSIKLKFLTATGDFDEDEYVLKSYAEAALKEKDEEIKSLKLLLSDCLDCFEHTTTRPIAVAIKKALEARDTTKHIVEPSPLTPEELAEYEQECREEARDDFR